MNESICPHFVHLYFNYANGSEFLNYISKMYVHMYKKGNVDRIKTWINLSSSPSLPFSGETNGLEFKNYIKQHVRLYV